MKTSPEIARSTGKGDTQLGIFINHCHVLKKVKPTLLCRFLRGKPTEK